MPHAVIVDDDEMTRALLRDIVVSEVPGVSVAYASDGEEALREIGRRSPSLLVLNMIMPRKTGFDVLEELSSRSQSIPTILTSGYVTKEELGERGVVLSDQLLFFKKPFSCEEFGAAVKRLLSLAT